MTTIRYDENNEYSWSFIEEDFEDSVRIYYRIVYDNGLETIRNSPGGVLSDQIQLDNPDAVGDGERSWRSITTNYDSDGTITARSHLYDDGVEEERGYLAGVLASYLAWDNPNNADNAKSWDTIEALYDAEGKIASRTTRYDDLTSREETFENGVRSRTVNLDPTPTDETSAKSWTSIETLYDVDGALASRILNYDSGVVREETYDAGTIRQITQRDEDPSGGDGAKSWSTITNTYSEAGVIESRVVEYDNARVSETSYDAAGKKVETRDTDGPDGGAYNWDTRVTQYDENGKVAETEINYDNGDGTTLEYVDGALFRRYDFDADGNAPWLARLLEYDADRNVVLRENYETAAETPSSFGFDFFLFELA